MIQATKKVFHLFFLVVTFWIFTGSEVVSQNIEVGLFGGASNYWGDLSNNTVMLSQTHPAASIIARYNFDERWSIKGFFGYGRISGADSLGSSDYRKARNLSFYTDIYEFSVQAEYNLVASDPAKFKILPYLFAGIGVFNFDPKTTFAGKVYELQPLGTEGQGTTVYNNLQKYALTTVCIPIGIGLKRRVSKHFSVGAEVGVRITFTNYLDDVGGNYADSRVVKASNGAIAGALSDRSWEKNPPEYNSNIFQEGDKRGFKLFPIPDLYFMGGVSVSYLFRNPGIKCPKF